MARGKTKIALIKDDKVLKSTFQKRKKGVIKKVMELTTLCDIIACIVIYGPAIGGKPPEIFTWPEDQERVLAAIRMYKEKMDHRMRTTDLCNYLRDGRKLNTADDVIDQSDGCGVDLVLSLLNWVDARIRAVDERIDFMCCQNLIFDDMMLVPQDQNFGYGTYLQNPNLDFGQFDIDRYAQTQCEYNPVYNNLVPQPKPIRWYQDNQNQMFLPDSYLLGMDPNKAMSMSNVNGSCQYYYEQQQQSCLKSSIMDDMMQLQRQQHSREKLQYLNNVPQPLKSSNMDYMMQLQQQQLLQSHKKSQYPYDDWSSPNASSNCSSATFDVQSLDDMYLERTRVCGEIQPSLDDMFLESTRVYGEIQPLGDGTGGFVPSCNYGNFNFD
ncbi:unnamed protein product [Rhodiola kirilowii]